MGRYYSGDIDGKFAFAVQASDDASFFGGQESEPNYINYYFDNEDLPDIEEGLATCKENLGEYNEKIKNFFAKNKAYSDEQLAKEELETTLEKTKELLTWYFRQQLGKKIYDCVKKQGDCSFEAEL